MLALAPEPESSTVVPSAPERPSVTAVAAALRAALTPLIESVAGQPPRPVRLMRGAGLDKSLASRLVKAARSESDQQFLHLVPSPTGLRILLEAARSQADAALLARVEQAVDRFQLLLDSLPGGRQALDAKLGEQSTDIRARREHMARQASFKAVSFLFGHYSETLSTSMFVLPAADGVHVEFIEVHRRIGLHRVTPGTAMPLLSLNASRPATDGGPELGPQMTSVQGDAQTQDALDFLVVSASSQPLPELQVVREGTMTTFVLTGDHDNTPPSRLTTAFRITRANQADPAQASRWLRTYMLHTPCHRLVRNIYIAEGLWPGVEPQVSFYLPGPTGAPMTLPDPTRRHYRQLNLTAHFTPLPAGREGRQLPGVPDQAETLDLVLAQAGLARQRFRGWRCEMSYPVPLIEMLLSISFNPEVA